jgi:hypothetical protein
MACCRLVVYRGSETQKVCGDPHSSDSLARIDSQYEQQGTVLQVVRQCSAACPLLPPLASYEPQDLQNIFPTWLNAALLPWNAVKGPRA